MTPCPDGREAQDTDRCPLGYVGWMDAGLGNLRQALRCFEKAFGKAKTEKQKKLAGHIRDRVVNLGIDVREQTDMIRNQQDDVPC